MKLNNTKTTVFLTVITHCPILSQVMFSRGQDEQLLRTFDFLNCVLWNTSNTLDLRSNCFIELLPSSSRPPTVFYRVGNSEPPTRCLPSKHDRIMTALAVIVTVSKIYLDLGRSGSFLAIWIGLRVTRWQSLSVYIHLGLGLGSLGYRNILLQDGKFIAPLLFWG